MGSIDRRIYVISDLHIGGAAAGERWPGSPSFKMMTHGAALAAFIDELTAAPVDGPKIELVVNGDFVDFLAEEHEVGDRWVPFIDDDGWAVRTFERIAKRDHEPFDALARLLARGHRLTVLIGNHDLELSLPSVRRALAKRIGADGRDFRYLYDGEALDLENAIIEHGNRYDPANTVDHDGLRRLRSIQSRREEDADDAKFTPPGGSQLVARVMNPIKERYPFVDLLKPESEPLVAFLLALEPGLKWELGKLALALRSVPEKALAKPDRRWLGGDVSSDQAGNERYFSDIGATTPRTSPEDEALKELLSHAVEPSVAGELVRSAPPPGSTARGSGELGFLGSDISSTRAGAAVLELLVFGDLATVKQRLPLVQRTLAALEGDQTFDDTVETGKRYERAANALARGSGGKNAFDYVVFGHTHHAKDLVLESGARYLNSGTWANLMRFPKALRSTNAAEAQAALAKFYEDLKESRLDGYIEFRPTYVRLDVAGDRVVAAATREYKSGVSVLSDT